MFPLSSVWTDVGAPLLIAFVAGAIAVFWPWLQALQRGRKFERIIRRELEELAPYPGEPVEGKPWWEHATKRFVHEEIFRRDKISQNREFLLSLDATVVYQVSQLWIALEKRDGNQWQWFLSELAQNPRVGSPELQEARDRWKRIIDAQPPKWRETMGVPSSFRQEAVLGRVQPLFERRFAAYSALLPHTEYGPEGEPREHPWLERKALADKLTDWYYADGAGLLLSGRALEQFLRARGVLLNTDSTDQQVQDELSRLRTALKIDLGVRQPEERDAAMAWPEDERW